MNEEQAANELIDTLYNTTAESFGPVFRGGLGYFVYEVTEGDDKNHRLPISTQTANEEYAEYVRLRHIIDETCNAFNRKYGSSFKQRTYGPGLVPGKRDYKGLISIQRALIRKHIDQNWRAEFMRDIKLLQSLYTEKRLREDLEARGLLNQQEGTRRRM